MYKPAPVEMTSAVDSVAFLFFLSSAIIRILMILNRYSRVPVYSAGTTKVKILGQSTCGKHRARCKDCWFFSVSSPWSSPCLPLRENIVAHWLFFSSSSQIKKKLLNKISEQHIHFQVLVLVTASHYFSVGLLLEFGAG